MMLNTYEAVWQHEDKSEETESQDYTVGTDTHVQEAHKSAAFLTLLAKQDKTDDDDERLSDAEIAAKKKELEHYAGLVQKQLDRYIQKV